MSGIVVKPVFTATLEHRTASSSCCAALLHLAPSGGYLCGRCRQRCDRVLSEPRVIKVEGHG